LNTCSTCGRELPEGALFCPGCGASAVDFSAAHTDISPSHFNSGMTATSPLATEPAAPTGDSGFAPPPPPPPEERRSYLSGRRGLVLAVITILAVLLVGTSFEAGMLGQGSAAAVNSPSDPLSGGQLYAAYAADPSRASASYTNKTVYIQDSLDFGIAMDNSGQFYSTVDSGNVILFWSSQSQLGGLAAGSTVLAKCSVNGQRFPPGAAYLESGALGPVVVLDDCALVSAQSQATASAAVSMDYD
jgi:zinc-ribbon domain